MIFAAFGILLIVYNLYTGCMHRRRCRKLRKPMRALASERRKMEAHLSSGETALLLVVRADRCSGTNLASPAPQLKSQVLCRGVYSGPESNAAFAHEHCP